jgi:RNA polymerase sigma factor (sigma-70 family)
MGSQKIHDWQHKFISDPESAWSEFLDQFSAHILRIITYMLSDLDQKMDAYCCILDKIKSQNCRRITDYYNESREYNFSVWLTVVVRNLCLDFVRDQRGRRRLPKYVQSLSHCDQLLYQYIYWKQYPREVTYDILTMNHGYTGTLIDMLERLDDIVRNIDRDQITHFSNTARLKFKNPLAFTLDALDIQSANNIPADAEIISQESRLIFDRIFNNLDTQDQLILKLHFLYGKTLKDTAKILKIKNIWKVHYRLKKAINFLNTELNKANISIDDLHDTNLK